MAQPVKDLTLSLLKLWLELWQRSIPELGTYICCRYSQKKKKKKKRNEERKRETEH